MSDQALTLSNKSCVFTYDQTDNSYDLISSESTDVRIHKARFSLDCQSSTGKKLNITPHHQPCTIRQVNIQDVHGAGVEIEISGTDTMTGLKLTYLFHQYSGQPYFLFRLKVENLGNSTYLLETLNLLEATPENHATLHFVQNSQPLDFLKVGWHDWVGTSLRHGNQHDIDSIPILRPFIRSMLYDPGLPIGKRKGEFWGENWGVLTDQRYAFVTGLVSMADQFGVLHVNCQPGRYAITLSTQADNIPLDPGETFESEWGYFEWKKLPVKDVLDEYVEAVSRQMKPRRLMTPPPAMWTHWYYYFEYITQEQFLDNLESAAQLRKIIPYEIFQLDGGYYQHWGDWLDFNDRFPIGPKELSTRITSKGFTPGIWLAPFVVDPRSNVALQHPDWLVKDTKGRPIKSGFFYDFYGNALDLTQTAVLEHVHTTLTRLTQEFGFGFIKTDFVYAGALPGIRQNNKLTRAQAFRRGMETIRDAIGEKIPLLGCGCPMGPSIGIVDYIRIGPDTAPHWTPYLWNQKWAIPIIKEERSIAALRNNMRHTINMSSLHRRWWWNDPDCLMVRSDNTLLNEEEVKSNVSLIGSNGNLLIHSDNLAKLSSKQLELVSLMTPLTNSDARVPDLLKKEMPETYMVEHDSAIGKWTDLVIFNWKDKFADMILDLKQVGLTREGPLHMFDFWDQRYSSLKNDFITFNQIPAHGCKLLRFVKPNNAISLVGDTLHLTQGAEIAEFQTSDKQLTLRTINMKRQVKGELWFCLPEKPLNAICNELECAITEVDQNIYKIAVEFVDVGTLKLLW